MLQATAEPGRPDGAGGDQAVAEPIPHWPGHVVELPLGQVHVRSAPAQPGAEPAVFVHGLGGSATNWTDLMDLLSRPQRPRQGAPAADWPGTAVLACSAIDLPGFGSSPPPLSGDYSVTAHAAVVAALIEAQGQGPVHLVGNSLGGAVSTRVAARWPDLVRTITLISPALPDLRPRPLPIRLALASLPGIGPAIMEWLRSVPAESRTDRTFRDLFPDPGVIHPSRRSAEVAEVLRRDTLLYASSALVLSARSLVGEYLKVGRNTLWRDAAASSAPALILHGSHDRLVNPVMAGKAARAFRDARVLVLPGVGHVAMMERPALVAAEIRAFLGRVSACADEGGGAKLARC